MIVGQGVVAAVSVVVVVVAAPLVALATPRLVRSAWRADRDWYALNPFAQGFVGESGRAGVNAAMPTLFVLLGYMSVVFLVLIGAIARGKDGVARSIALPLLGVGACAGGALIAAIVLFLRPRSLVPPPLREASGLVQRSRHGRRSENP